MTKRSGGAAVNGWLVGIGVVATAAALFGCSGGGGDSGGSAGDAYPAEARSTFVGNCERTSGGNTATCTCLFDYIKAHLSFEEFRLADTALGLGSDPSPEFIQVVADAREQCQ